MHYKPILIDALHINMGGALMILNHLINRLIARNINFMLLKDIRCPVLENENKIANIQIISSDNKSRYKFYKGHRKDFKSVLCLGNIPPPIKMSATVYTYIHNVSILKIPSDYPLLWKVKSWLKKRYISFYSKFSDFWIVQTENTSDLVRKFLPVKNKKVYIYPFYKPQTTSYDTLKRTADDYVFVGEHTNAKGHEYLVDAWVTLSKMGFNKKLHLTVREERFTRYIDEAIKKGANIENHGFVKHEEVMEIYKKCKATIYPSLNESLGLGIIEAAECGCDVIGSDLPYIYCVCNPSEVFIPKNSQSIIDAILRYEKGKSQHTELIIKDKADELIDFIS